MSASSSMEEERVNHEMSLSPDDALKRETIDYQLEDHFSIYKKTPTSDETSETGVTHTLPDCRHTTTFSEGVESLPNFEFIPGARDTLLMEIPLLERESTPEQELKRVPNFLCGVYAHQLRLSPVTEIDENRQQSIYTTRGTGAFSNPSVQTSQLNTMTSPTSQDGCPSRLAKEVDKPRHITKPPTEKSARKSMEDLPDGKQMMDIDEDREDTPTALHERDQIQTAPTEQPDERSRSSRSRRTSKSSLPRSSPPATKRRTTRLSTFKEGVMEKLQSEPGTWKYDVQSYLSVRLHEFDPGSIHQVGNCIDKLLQDASDAESWLEFLRLEIHQSVQIDLSETLRFIQSSSECIPSLMTLYLWALLLAQTSTLDASYHALKRDYRRIALRENAAFTEMLSCLIPSQGTSNSPTQSVSPVRPSKPSSLGESFQTTSYIEEQLLRMVDYKT